MAKFPLYTQLDAMDCGPTCLRMVAAWYGKQYSLQTLRDKSYITREGVSMLGISDAAEAIGFRTMGVSIPFEVLKKEAPLPCIVHWKQRHFVVVYNISSKYVYVADPAGEKIRYTHEEFCKNWISTTGGGQEKGIALLLEPLPDFYALPDEKLNKTGFAFLFRYLTPYRQLLVQLLLAMLTGSLLSLIFPFLTQSIVDFGINTQSINFIYLVLIAQLVLYVSRTLVDFIRGWIMLHISTRINISIISDFLIKLMKLPIGFFDIKKTGDLLQRIGDHHRIQSFLTGSSLEIIFSVVNLLIFSVVLAIYDLRILALFWIGSLLYAGWILLFMKKRRELDYKRFAQMSDNQGNLIQLITGMQEIKLNNCERQKRWEWENIQAKLFRINIKSLYLNQYQQAGSIFLNEVKNIFISFLAAKAVIDGSMTLGMMVAVQYIIGQLNAPVQQMIGFMQAAQDARISLERLGEIHQKDDEEEKEADVQRDLPSLKQITISDLVFQYEGPHSPKVLDTVNLTIPEGKITAIVGTSGSGKTTLIKLMLGFYPPTSGTIRVGNNDLPSLSQRMWRQSCGVVMQDGFIFSDSIAKNIAIGDDIPDREKLLNAVHVANIADFIESLPLGFNTKIGSEGSGLSQGQKQRILIARAVYKNPTFIFFDEATNALDANNEKVIMQNLQEFFNGRTVVVVAHRLSTVRNADQIVVLNKGVITETGTHDELTAKRGEYFELVRNQLELGS